MVGSLFEREAVIRPLGFCNQRNRDRASNLLSGIALGHFSDTTFGSRVVDVVRALCEIAHLSFLFIAQHR